jgi:hypothetical protein
MSIQDLKMTYSAKITLKYDSTWSSTGGIYDDEMLPEEHITFEVPAEDLNATQLFRLFEKFMLAMGHTETGIAKGAAYVSFNDMRSFEEMKKTADEYDLVMKEDHIKEVCKLEAEVRDLKAKLSRALNPDAEQYLPEEMDAMDAEAQQGNKKELLNKLENADVVCFDCGSKYGEYHDGVSSVWEGKCNVCGEVKKITESRDFKYLAKGIKELSK